ALLQRRRLGRELHDADRGFRRPSQPAALDQAQGSHHAQRLARAVPGRDRAGGVKIAIVTDAWRPQANAVVQTLSTTAPTLRTAGKEVMVVEPNQFRTFPCATYPEIRLAWLPYRRLSQLLHEFAPDCIHIATEGTLGLAARSWCRRHRFPFTTSYHTQFPEY